MKLVLLTATLITVVLVHRVRANPADLRHPNKLESQFTIKHQNERKAHFKNSKVNALGPPISAEEIAAAIANSSLMKPPPEEDHTIENSGGFEGDIILTPEQQTQMEIGGRSAVKDVTLLWEDGIIHYTISSVFTTDDRQVIARAIAEFQEMTCLKFVSRTTESDYIEIISIPFRCGSNAGRIGGRQLLSIGQNDAQGNGCMYVGIAIHEFMHASGFWHEQSRYDRDDYVTINWENIWPGLESQFTKRTTSISTDLGLPYDYKSIMHYGAKDFSKNGKPTITPKKAGETIGQREGFSQLDVQGLNLLYKCGDCPEGFFSSGPSQQCFKLIKHTKWRNWAETDTYCREMGLALPRPDDPITLRAYIVDNYPDVNNQVWLNAKGDGTSFKWQSDGLEINNSDPLWMPKHWSDGVYPGQFVQSSDCLLLNTVKFWFDLYPDQPYLPLECGKSMYGVTLCERIN